MSGADLANTTMDGLEKSAKNVIDFVPFPATQCNPLAPDGEDMDVLAARLTIAEASGEADDNASVREYGVPIDERWSPVRSAGCRNNDVLTAAFEEQIKGNLRYLETLQERLRR